jgi:hypothetical protein
MTTTTEQPHDYTQQYILGEPIYLYMYTPNTTRVSASRCEASLAAFLFFWIWILRDFIEVQGIP